MPWSSRVQPANGPHSAALRAGALLRTVVAGTGSDVSEGFRIAAESDCETVSEIGARREFRFQKRAHITAHLLGLSGTHFAVQVQSSHQANSANRKLRGLQNRMIAQHTDFQAAAPEIGDTTSL